MREGIRIELSAGDRERLAAVVADCNSPQKHVWRAQIMVATAEGCGTAEIMRRAGVSKPCVWRWQERFTREGVAGLLCDKTGQRRAVRTQRRRLAGGHRYHRVVAQVVVIDHVFVSQRDPKHPLPHEPLGSRRNWQWPRMWWPSHARRSGLRGNNVFRCPLTVPLPFIRSFLRFSHSEVVSDDRCAPGL